MLFQDYTGKCVEVIRKNFATDTEYYSTIISLKFNLRLKQPTLSVNEICDMI